MIRQMSRRWAGVAMTLALGVASPATAQNATLHADTPGPVVDRHIFSQFAEHLGYGIYGGIWVGPKSSIPNIHGYRKDVVEALRALHVPPKALVVLELR